MARTLLILSGQSGSGKSTAKRALEDHGFMTVDNLPPGAVDGLLDTLGDTPGADHIALVIDAREPGRLRSAPALVEQLRSGQSKYGRVGIVFFEAHEDVLVKRYSETRRRHPLDDGCGLLAAIAAEKSYLVPLRELADYIIDSSGRTPHELRDYVTDNIVAADKRATMQVEVVSFGFKYGVPLDVDMMFDVRFLPNPYFVPELRDKTGLDAQVRAYVLAQPEAKDYVSKTTEYLHYLLPAFRQEGKRYLTIGVGCTGGQHRSVTVAIELQKSLSKAGDMIAIRHRDARVTNAAETKSAASSNAQETGS